MKDITTEVKAVNPKYQSVVNKAVNWMEKYELANDQRNIASDNSEHDYEEDDKLWRKWDRRCIKAYDKYLEYMEELPKREQDKVERRFTY
tara:strand:- start:190 stop:459 length:270 start_codon:yes stop_codon:yes gene_type:complete